MLLIVLLMFVLSGCSPKPAGEKQVAQVGEDTNNEAIVKEEAEISDEPIILNLEGGDWGYPTPYAHYSRGPGAYKMKLIFDSLIERGEDGLIPWLAESWDITDGGSVYTFKIREDVKWQDGEPMTTEDIKFSFEYYAQHPPVTDDLNISKDNFIEKIDVIDEHNIEIKVSEVDATLLERFGSARILPKHIWENVDDPIKFDGPEAVIGCGPYKLNSYDQEQGAYQLEAFEEYWGGKPKADLLQFIPVSDAILSFENNEIDLTEVTPDIVSKYQEDPQYTVIENPAFWGYKIVLNMDTVPEFKDKALRQAMAYGINREELVEKVARGAGKVASPGYLPTQHMWYNKDVKQYDYDLDKAKELIGDQTYKFTLLTGNSNAEVRIGELIKISLSNIGIELEIKSQDTKSRDAAVKGKDYEMVLTGHGGWGNDADILRKQYAQDDAQVASISGNIPGYNNEEINKTSKEQLLELNEGKRKEIIYHLQEVIAEEIPQIPLYNTSTYTVYRPGKYNGWKHVFNHHEVTHNKLSFVELK